MLDMKGVQEVEALGFGNGRLKARLSMDYSTSVVSCSDAASEDSNICPVSLSEASCTILHV